MKLFRIFTARRKPSHRMKSDGFVWPFYISKKKYLYVKCQFEGELKDYQMPKSISKLFGVFMPTMHHNSSRIGFNYNDRGGYNIFFYYYRNGERITEKANIIVSDFINVEFLLNMHTGYICINSSTVCGNQEMTVRKMRTIIETRQKTNDEFYVSRLSMGRRCNFIDISPYIGGENKLQKSSSLIITTVAETFN